MTDTPVNFDDELGLELGAAGLRSGPDGIWTDAGENVGVLTSGGHAVVGWIEHVWRGAAPPPDHQLRDAVHLAAPVDPETLAAAIDRAQRAGVSKRQVCRFCGETYPPGLMHEDDVCHGCAERHLGVVH